MGKRATSTVEVEIFEVEGFDVRFLGGAPGSGPYVDPYPYERAASHGWTVKKWRTTRWTPSYPDFDVEVLDADGRPVHGKTLLSTVRASYGNEQEVAIEQKESEPLAILATSAGIAVHPHAVSSGTTKTSGNGFAPKSDIYDIADRLWATADELRANSALKASEYSVPVLGLIFLKFAESRFAEAEAVLEGTGSTRRTITRTTTRPEMFFICRSRPALQPS